MSKAQDLFFELLSISTGACNELRCQYSDKQWCDALSIAQDQAIVGVLFSALEKLPKEQLPSKKYLLQWIGNTEMVEIFSFKVSEASSAVINYFREKSFPCVILKGSSVAQYYPQPYRRSSGDIDVWVDGSREQIYKLARKEDKDGILYGVNYHHVELHLLDELLVEVHIWPSYLSSPFKNKLLQFFCNLHRPSMDSDKPSLAFDRVYILQHCYRHICGPGVGMRQIMDYFYVLKQGFTQEEKTETVNWINKLGMGRFARGIMWVMQSCFGLEDQYLLFDPDEKEGRFIMKEVMLTGNMGHSDARNWGSKESAISRFFFNLRRDMYLVRHYPYEVLWQPFFSIWLYFWRLSKGLLKDRNK